jgi:Integral membrane protein TerC family
MEVSVIGSARGTAWPAHWRASRKYLGRFFAIDSVPAIYALTREPFVVFTSNVFAIPGQRSMYFMLGGSVAIADSAVYRLRRGSVAGSTYRVDEGPIPVI